MCSDDGHFFVSATKESAVHFYVGQRRDDGNIHQPRVAITNVVIAAIVSMTRTLALKKLPSTGLIDALKP